MSWWLPTASWSPVPWLSLCLQAAWISLQFSGYCFLIICLFFPLVIFICNYVRNVLVYKTLTCLNPSQNKTFLSHIFLDLSLNVATKILIAVCTYPGHFEFPATSFSTHKIILNSFSVPHLQLLHPRNDNWILISNCSFTGTVRAVVSTSSLKQWVVNLAHDIYYIS